MSSEVESPKNCLIFMGTGSSTGTPAFRCLMKSKCTACLDSLLPGSRNKRRNPSILVQYKGKNILFDCGKTFRDAFINALLTHKITTVDSVVLTHNHADATLGLDDLRDLTEKNSIPIYLRQVDFPHVQNTFPYLVDVSKASGSGHVSKLSFHIFDDVADFVVQELTITPLVVEHGPNNTACGFVFGDAIVYLSDLNAIPPETRARLPPVINVLILDALFLTRDISSHYNLPQALDEIRVLRPKKTYLIGMSHEFDYHRENAKIAAQMAQEGLDVEMAYDGLKLDLAHLLP